MNYFYLIFISLLTVDINAQRATGLIFDDGLYDNAPVLTPSLQFTSKNLVSISLKKYCPIPMNQGRMASCVGWATSYAGVTIARAIQDNETNTDLITENAKSALYVFNQVKINDCDDGANIDKALDLIKTKGTCYMKDFNPSSCSEIPPDMEDFTVNNTKISSWQKLFEKSASPSIKINAIINVLQTNKPVIIGMNITPSFENVGNDGYWQPDINEKISGGHAMCIIGFNKMEKTFEIMNSWGIEWGNKGFFKISFDDFAKYCKYAYRFSLLDQNQNQKNFEFKTSFEIEKLMTYDFYNNSHSYQKLKAVREYNEYKIGEGIIKLYDSFKIFVKNLKENSFVYIFSVTPDLTTSIIVPEQFENSDGFVVKSVSIVPDESSFVVIPSIEGEHIQADKLGLDYLIILISKNEISNLESQISGIGMMSGTMLSRLEKIFGNELVPEKNINYALDHIGFNGRSTTGSIVPLVISTIITE